MLTVNDVSLGLLSTHYCFTGRHTPKYYTNQITFSEKLCLCPCFLYFCCFKVSVLWDQNDQSLWQSKWHAIEGQHHATTRAVCTQHEWFPGCGRKRICVVREKGLSAGLRYVFAVHNQVDWGAMGLSPWTKQLKSPCLRFLTGVDSQSPRA